VVGASKDVLICMWCFDSSEARVVLQQWNILMVSVYTIELTLNLTLFQTLVSSVIFTRCKWHSGIRETCYQSQYNYWIVLQCWKGDEVNSKHKISFSFPLCIKGILNSRHIFTFWFSSESEGWNFSLAFVLQQKCLTLYRNVVTSSSASTESCTIKLWTRVCQCKRLIPQLSFLSTASFSMSSEYRIHISSCLVTAASPWLEYRHLWCYYV